MEEDQSGNKRKPPSCSRCSNHGKDSPLTHHKCPYEECDCLLCKLTWARKMVMRKQQQMWRHRKDTQKWDDAAAEAVGGAAEGDAEEGGGKQKEKYCDMCRNHAVLVRNRGHKRSCKYENCPCDLCSFTRKRRHIMQLQQKVKRSKITTHQFQEATEWITKLTAELESLGIGDTPMTQLVTPMAPTSNVPSHGHFHPPHPAPGPPPPGLPPSGPPPPSVLPGEGSYPSNIPHGLYTAAHTIDSFPHSHQPPSCSRMMARPFMPVAAASAAEHYPSTSYHMDPGSSCSSPPNSCPVGGPVSGASSYGLSSVNVHLPMDPSNSFQPICPSSPSYTPLPASPNSDYDSPYPGCPSPLLPYLAMDNQREMTAIAQPSCSMISNAQSSEPLDCSDQSKHSSRSHKHAYNRLQEYSENPSVHTNRPLHGSPQTTRPGWLTDSQSVEEMTQEMRWAGQRRKSEGEGFIHLPYRHRHSQRRGSDTTLHIKALYRPSQKGINDLVIQEGYMQDPRRTREDEPQKHFKPDLSDRCEGIIEKYHDEENKTRNICLVDQKRRLSEGSNILSRHSLNERRCSDGDHKKYFALSQKRPFDSITQGQIMHPMEKSDEEIHSPYGYREIVRRDSDETSQGSYCIEYRRSSIDTVHENYRLGGRRPSDDFLRGFYWPCHRSDSGETIPENSQDQRTDSDEYILGHYPSNKDNFFEDTVRRERRDQKVLERINRSLPMTDTSMSCSPEHRSHYVIQPPPLVVDEYQQASGVRKDERIQQIDDSDVTMNWTSHDIHVEEQVYPRVENDQEMDGPLDLTTKPSNRD